MTNIKSAMECASPGNPLLLLGPPGIGKTAQIQQWAEETGKTLLIEHPVIAQSIDYRGLPAIEDGQAKWYPLGNLKQITEQDGPDTVVLFDDVGQSSQSVQAALMQLVWGRKLGDAKIRDNVTFILASNNVVDRSGVRPMLAALVGRCQTIQVKFHMDNWIEWALKQPDLDANIIGFLKFRPDCFQEVPAEPMKPFCTPRTLTSMGYLTKKGIKNINLLAGWVGLGIAADFIAYTNSIAKIPSIYEILKNPHIVKKITDPGLLHAITFQAARLVSEKPAEIINLSEVLKSGWEIQLISAATSVDESFKKTPQFKGWAVSHQNLL